MGDIIDLGALRAERAELANRIAAIDRIFNAIAALDGSVTASTTTSPTTTVSGSGGGSGRQRRTNQEVEEIKTAIASELAGTPGSKTEITQRLQKMGVLTGSRRDRELVLRTLKELVDSGAAAMADDTYESASVGDPKLTVEFDSRSDATPPSIGQFDRIRGTLAGTGEE